MPEPHTPATGAPPADDVKENVQQVDETANLGAGDEEPDPATGENPPQDLKAGDKAREKTGAAETQVEAGIGGSDT